MPISSNHMGIGLAAVASLSIIGLVYSKLQKNKRTMGEDVGEDLAPALTEEETTQIIEVLAKAVTELGQKMLQHVQTTKAQLAQSGQQVSDDQIMQYIVSPQFLSNLSSIEEGIYDRFDITEDELEEAVEEYSVCNNIIKSSSEKIKMMITQIGGVKETPAGPMGGAPAPAQGGAEAEEGSITVTDLLTAFVSAVLEATEKYTNNWVETHGPPAGPEDGQAFSNGLMQTQMAVQQQALQQFGLTEQDFQNLLMQNAENPEVQKIMAALQMGTTQILGKHGIGIQ